MDAKALQPDTPVGPVARRLSHKPRLIWDAGLAVPFRHKWSRHVPVTVDG
jgi:hypothetical protein